MSATKLQVQQIIYSPKLPCEIKNEGEKLQYLLKDSVLKAYYSEHLLNGWK